MSKIKRRKGTIIRTKSAECNPHIFVNIPSLPHIYNITRSLNGGTGAAFTSGYSPRTEHGHLSHIPISNRATPWVWNITLNTLPHTHTHPHTQASLHTSYSASDPPPPPPPMRTPHPPSSTTTAPQSLPPHDPLYLGQWGIFPERVCNIEPWLPDLIKFLGAGPTFIYTFKYGQNFIHHSVQHLNVRSGRTLPV